MITLLLLAVLQDPAPLIEKLRSDDLEERERAGRELMKLGEPALEALRKAHDGEKDSEARARLKTVIARIEKPIRYGRGTGAWVIRTEHRAEPPMPWGERLWFSELRGDGTGAATPWKTVPEIYGLSFKREQVAEAIDLAIAADLLDGDFSRVERGDVAPPTGGQTTLIFRHGKHERRIQLVWPGQLPEPGRKLVELLDVPLNDPAKFGGVGLVSKLREADGAEPAAKALRALGPTVVPNLKWALHKEEDETVSQRLKTLLDELQRK